MARLRGFRFFLLLQLPQLFRWTWAGQVPSNFKSSGDSTLQQRVFFDGEESSCAFSYNWFYFDIETAFRSAVIVHEGPLTLTVKSSPSSKLPALFSSRGLVSTVCLVVDRGQPDLSYCTTIRDRFPAVKLAADTFSQCTKSPGRVHFEGPGKICEIILATPFEGEALQLLTKEAFSRFCRRYNWKDDIVFK